MKRNSDIDRNDPGFNENPVEFNISVPPSKRSKEQAWDMLMQAIDSQQQEPAKLVTMQSRYTWMLVAASVIVVMVVSTLFVLNTEYRIETQQAQTLEHRLPDGSVVILNSNSWITYKRAYSWISRSIRMEGEAYFKVISGKGKFVVTDTQNQQVVVTGTEFKLISRGNTFELNCFEGAVNVSISGSQPVSVQKGESVVKRNGVLIHSKQSDKELTKPVWVTHEFSFANQPLSKVFEQISDFYQVEIETEGFEPENRYFTGTIPTGNAIESLDVIAISMGLTYTVNTDSTVFTFR
ncbi:MAG: FecR family protein [Bacteroidota bacterium]